MDKTSTEDVEKKRAYADQVLGWLQFAKDKGAWAIAVVNDLREGGYKSFILTNEDTEESMRNEFDDERYFKLVEIIPVPPAESEALRAS